MNCKQAKQIDIVTYLKKLGIQPVKQSTKDCWFLSPFRNEKTPSFKVNQQKNIWFDFGEGFGGTMIDLITKLNNCNVKEALIILSDTSFSFQQQDYNDIQKYNYSITKTTELSNRNLIQYLQKRKLHIEFTRKFCCEIHYTFNHKKQYYGIGFKNDSNGYEIRNKYFKGCLGIKDITALRYQSTTVSLFESWSDFLSYLTLKNKLIREDFIILNSTMLIKKVPELLKDYITIKTFFDNDTAGINATIFLKSVLNNEIIDCRKFYKNHNDLNDFLIARKN